MNDQLSGEVRLNEIDDEIYFDWFVRFFKLYFFFFFFLIQTYEPDENRNSRNNLLGFVTGNT